MQKYLLAFLLLTIRMGAAHAQNVGIGTTTPTAKLEINSGQTDRSGLRFTNLKRKPAIFSGSTPYYYTSGVQSATGLAFDNDNNLYVTSLTGNKIYKITPDGVKTDFVTTGLSGPHDIVFGPDNNLYVSNYYGGDISKVSLSGSLSVYNGTFDHPIGLTFAPDGYLYVVESGTGKIWRLVTNSGPGGTTALPFVWATGLSSPYNCVYDKTRDKILVSNYGANNIVAIPMSGGNVANLPGVVIVQGPAFTGIAVDAFGSIYAAIPAINSVYKIDITTQAGGSSTASGEYFVSTYSFDVCLDGYGGVYAANQTIDKVTVKQSPRSTMMAVDNQGSVVACDLSFQPTTSNGTGTFLTNSDVQTGGVVLARNFITTSDMRLKRDITPLPSPLHGLSKLKGYHYYWKDSLHGNDLQTGLLAQEVQAVFPELVSPIGNGKWGG